MKKIYFLSTYLVIGVCSLKAQTSIQALNTSGGNSALSNNATIQKTTTASTEDPSGHDIEIKNISVATYTYIVVKTDVTLNTVIAGSDEAASRFCTGLNCYTPTTYTASFVLQPNAHLPLMIYLQEASIVGPSVVKYKVYNESNPSDEFNVTMKYNNATSIKVNSALLSNVSDVFPNPSSSQAYMNITSVNDVDGITISVINSLGSLVSSKKISLNAGKNVVVIDSENLNSGIYFVTVLQGNSKTTKKITVSK